MYSCGLHWGGSSAGRASRSQCEGREFDPPPLHQTPDGKALDTPRGPGLFCFRRACPGGDRRAHPTPQQAPWVCLRTPSTRHWRRWPRR
ncbi:hypothetical protein L535_2481 [Bordetella bronchiseptica SBL-F6116]|nr:hypothetical protein L535_2481 [Bordetella bronchiseptica SBL-F6116]